jgi:hypothetical protein
MSDDGDPHRVVEHGSNGGGFTGYIDGPAREGWAAYPRTWRAWPLHVLGAAGLALGLVAYVAFLLTLWPAFHLLGALARRGGGSGQT